MRKLRVTLALALAAGAAAVAVPVQAWSSWCDTEPPITVVTPNGNPVTINNFIGYSAADRQLVHDVLVYGTATATADGDALITIYVVTPEGGHADLKVTSQSFRYGATSNAGASWGEVTQLQLVVPDPPPPANAGAGAGAKSDD